jgi:hypothetical protein
MKSATSLSSAILIPTLYVTRLELSRDEERYQFALCYPYSYFICDCLKLNRDEERYQFALCYPYTPALYVTVLN